MPKDWLKTIVDHYEAIPNTGIISIYSMAIEKLPERLRDKPEGKVINGKHIIGAMPMGAKFLSRDLKRKVGYYKEDLGLYGWEDVLWAERAEKVTKEMGLVNYIIKDFYADHLGHTDAADYVAFKKKEALDQKKHDVCNQYRQAGHPYYTPF